jgi:hypothetical protein
LRPNGFSLKRIFARFLHAQSASLQPLPAASDAWLNDSEAEMQAEDARWQAIYDQQRPEFLRLREQAIREIASGETQPLFDEQGGVANKSRGKFALT